VDNLLTPGQSGGQKPLRADAVQKIGKARALDAYAADARTVGFVTVKHWLGRECGPKAPSRDPSRDRLQRQTGKWKDSRAMVRQVVKPPVATCRTRRQAITPLQHGGEAVAGKMSIK
jgi:hypothetical protein